LTPGARGYRVVACTVTLGVLTFACVRSTRMTEPFEPFEE
jgi:hypothetical protein